MGFEVLFLKHGLREAQFRQERADSIVRPILEAIEKTKSRMPGE
jgi:hypothetical protein